MILEYIENSTLISLAKKENNENFHKDINAIISWSQEWDLKFNASKCSILYLGHASSRYSYKLDNMIIQSKNIESNLGIMFSCNLKFNEHIDSIVLETNKQLWYNSNSF